MNGHNNHRIALFLDFENLVTNTGISATGFDLQPSIDRLLEKGKVVFRRAYCDWSRFGEAKGRLHEHGVDLIDVPPSTRAGKNGADMRLVIDALELCYAREHIDTFVIGSGDSDFCPLAYKLRENGRTVIGLAVKGSTSPLFVKACDEFLYLRPKQARGEKDSRDSVSAGEAAPASRAGQRGKGQGEKTGEREAVKARGQSKVPDVARSVVKRLLGAAAGPINPSLIKETIVRKEPDFDERDHGFSSFARLLEAMEQEGLLKRQQQGRQWYVVGPETETEPPKGKKHGAHAKRGAAPEEPEEDVEEELESYPDPEDTE